ncbi:pyruvate:ferredoxin (flavodoxin) oxidoreductase [Synechococcus elongatus]|uniref:Pyruvate-flavodoxin oxidoreductase n=2 Tax=Synechococcus elongatus TaxID=32046 RepID=Q31KK5_SYNE7|nr:pyruvate:ferredoxin (flavodoxin) oxidoreductase [Synechococcus elongatus]ABB58414.1 Pyruvate:ferredoxin (flavodoxin) oxidoreductase [Synechococcus elongatus PCC 7942 = FACHB-805]AJD57123.1 pyruvate-flavodoxin oxidoreductase [Synechococcus elongatus UTEX 2973]MBD2587136.1 pyruvate:ferredoxin (flavodoxin) oxidoreductase [Synechococcus elongatus FACHB-242]MBD2688207.1 pyruvate:ferredoxin (flavodoxin) oxidoreductase [Synechococcus elongatus FACHB-1061]MBD2706082.1 pyruvate:ferredoxin (flavodoxi
MASSPVYATLDGNEAVARVAYRLSEVIAIYPITPASPMGEWADAWAATHRPNLWGDVPSIVEMQSEAGAAGAVHGALQVGALTTTFTASQGLLLMIPNLYKIAGELTPMALHIAARSLAAQGLSIFGDHSDVMAVRGTGCALLCSASVQEAQDFAAIALRASLQSRIPFLHFFDGFRTSHEIQKIALLPDEVLQQYIPAEAIREHRHRALSPDHPVIRGTAQNPDVYFQARETVNRYYNAAPALVQAAMDEFAQLTGRAYELVDYVGAPDAERAIVVMGSGAEVAEQTVLALQAQGEKVGVLKLRLYRPFPAAELRQALPATVKAIAVLDRCKEPGASGEPLYLDVVEALSRLEQPPRVIGGRYGLSSKEFTPAMTKAIFDHLSQTRLQHPFTIGIEDDVTHLSLPWDPSWSIEAADTVRAIFYGLGSDGTVGANKNSIKIIGEDTDNWAQGYFVYDSKKSGSVTVSHLRFGPRAIAAPYLIRQANFVACHQWQFLHSFDLIDSAAPHATLLINSPYSPEETWQQLPEKVQQGILDKQLQPWVINADALAAEQGLGRHINTVMQVAFFALSGVLPQDTAIAAYRRAVQKTYGKKGQAVVDANLAIIEPTLAALKPLPIGIPVAVGVTETPAIASAPPFVRDVLGAMLARKGDQLPVSALPVDGTYPSGTSCYEKRNISDTVPVWEPDLCVQCGKCLLVCPHGVIRAKVYESEVLEAAPETFKHAPARDATWSDRPFTIQVSTEDCTGCQLCVEVCPARDRQQPRRKALNMAAQAPLREAERHNWDFFLSLPEVDRSALNLHKIGQQQLQQPLFEFSGACAGCGETPYLKLMTQLFGDRLLVANATGCSSIYGGNLPTTPWTHNAEGRGPAWSNSLFEDNAEFGLGFRVALDQQEAMAQQLLSHLAAIAGSPLSPELVQQTLNADQSSEAGIFEQRDRVQQLKQQVQDWLSQEPDASVSDRLNRWLDLADTLVRKSVWLVGGDGWAYDIGFGGLDHVLASGRNVNILVLDTEVYSNTGGQMSKSTPRAAVAKFAAGGKPSAKKDLGLIAMTYGSAYVASVALGARDEHTIRTFIEAESYPGPSLIIAYSHCIAHGIDMTKGLDAQKRAVDSGRWLLYRYDPRRRDRGDNTLQLDSRSPHLPLSQALYSENRFQMLRLSQPEAAQQLLDQAQADVDQRWQFYQALAKPTPKPTAGGPQ